MGDIILDASTESPRTNETMHMLDGESSQEETEDDPEIIEGKKLSR